MEKEKVYAALVKSGATGDDVKTAYLLGAVDALRKFADFRVPEVEMYYRQLGLEESDCIWRL